MVSFEGLGIEEGLLQSIHTLGFTQPTPIQEKAIPVLLQGTKILLALLKQERAKQLRLDCPCCSSSDKQQKFPQALVICPTRELCMQITKTSIHLKEKQIIFLWLLFMVGPQLGCR